jgi:16S rRNA (uracil1498-N3)-methyltransferase
MRLTRIYQQQDLRSGEDFCLSKATAHHLIHVLRLAVGSEFLLFNGRGGEFKAKINSLQKDSVAVQIGEFKDIDRESPLQINLMQALIRPEKMDYVLQKATELGVMHITPLITERAVLQLSPERWKKRLAHWHGIVINACEQSGRTRIPTIASPIPFAAGICDLATDIRVILVPQVPPSPLQLTKANTHVTLLVGPEGGWSTTEINFAVQQGYMPIRLGPRILRAETASLVAISLLQNVLGDIALDLV